MSRTNISKAGAWRTVPDFSALPSDSTRSSGRKLKHEKCHLNARKNIFTLRVAEPWNSCPGENVGSHCLEILKPTWTYSCVTCSG